MEKIRPNFASWGLPDFLRDYPEISICPSTGDRNIHLKGRLEFHAQYKEHEPIHDSFELEIIIPPTFPNSVPDVREIGGRIPATFHTNPGGVLCLGAPIRVLLIINRAPSLSNFGRNVIIPYLYNYAYFEKYKVLPLGELPHGREGLDQDYRKLFGVQNTNLLLKTVGMKRRCANKQICPCGSGRRVGRCHHLLLNRLRRLAPRSWYRNQQYLLTA